MTVIAMPREMGTNGKDVAFGVAERLGLDSVDRELVEFNVAARMGVNQLSVHEFQEGNPSLWDRWKVSPKKLAQCTAEEMFERAESANVVMRGWGAVTLLRRIPHVLCLRVCAPMEYRINAMVERLGLQADVAKTEILNNDKAHARSAQNRGVSNWTEPTNFDLILNSERLSVADCVEQVCGLAQCEAFIETPESRAVLSNLLNDVRMKG